MYKCLNKAIIYSVQTLPFRLQGTEQTAPQKVAVAKDGLAPARVALCTLRLTDTHTHARTTQRHTTLTFSLTLTHSLTHSLPHSLTHSLSHSTHSLTHSPAHSLPFSLPSLPPSLPPSASSLPAYMGALEGQKSQGRTLQISSPKTQVLQRNRKTCSAPENKEGRRMMFPSWFVVPHFTQLAWHDDGVHVFFKQRVGERTE